MKGKLILCHVLCTAIGCIAGGVAASGIGVFGGAVLAIVVAGATVNILFGILVYFILVSTVLIQFEDPGRDIILNRFYYGAQYTGTFISSIFENIS